MFDSLSGREVPVRADEGGLLPGKKRSRWRIFVLSVALAVIMCSAAAPAARATVGPHQIDAFLLAHGSPLAGEGQAFYTAGRRNGVDPAFLVAISGAESSFGQYLFSAGSQTAAYNAFNWFYASTRAGSAFPAGTRRSPRSPQGLRGPLYYGAGRYAVGAIAPDLLPAGHAGLDRQRHGLHAGARRRSQRHPVARRARVRSARAARRSTACGSWTGRARRRRSSCQRPVPLRPAHTRRRRPPAHPLHAHQHGSQAGSWKAVILRLQGPVGPVPRPTAPRAAAAQSRAPPTAS